MKISPSGSEVDRNNVVATGTERRIPEHHRISIDGRGL